MEGRVFQRTSQPKEEIKNPRSFFGVSTSCQQWSSSEPSECRVKIWVHHSQSTDFVFYSSIYRKFNKHECKIAKAENV